MTGLEYFKGLEKSMRTVLPASPWTMVRVDGASFSKYTKGLAKPYDEDFTAAMTETALRMCQEIQAPIAFAYVQSDEISILLDNRTDKGELMPWYGGQVQKIVSMTAAMATAQFNQVRMEQNKVSRLALFDSRIFSLDTYEDVVDYIAWRQRDSIKNTISMAAHNMFSNTVLAGVNTEDRRRMLKDIDAPWEDLPSGFRFGRFIYPVKQLEMVSYIDKRTKKECLTKAFRTHWKVETAVNRVSGIYPESKFGLQKVSLEAPKLNKSVPNIVVKSNVDVSKFDPMKVFARNRQDVINAAK